MIGAEAETTAIIMTMEEQDIAHQANLKNKRS
jgi:hypothetical protein